MPKAEGWLGGAPIVNTAQRPPMTPPPFGHLPYFAGEA